MPAKTRCAAVLKSKSAYPLAIATVLGSSTRWARSCYFKKATLSAKRRTRIQVRQKASSNKAITHPTLNTQRRFPDSGDTILFASDVCKYAWL
uniref:Uncharacterized protein n=1 Tax=Mycetohabitans sp. TaxID=2571162 RepID=A0A6B9HD69_9BURK|nr:hypothetical protein [Mycetohabitans sp.]